MFWPLLVAVLGVADPDLERAEQAFRAADYDAVLTALDRAFRSPLDDRQRARAFELKAMTSSAFDDSASAVDAFVSLLELNPKYKLPVDASPKLIKLLDKANERRALSRRVPQDLLSSPPLMEPNPAPPSTSVLRQWWFWTGVAVIAGGATSAVFLSRSPLPSGTLGRDRFP